jgi:hypothetical protein
MAQSGVLKGPRVQLTDGLERTKYEADLSANDAPAYHKFHPTAGRVLRW